MIDWVAIEKRIGYKLGECECICSYKLDFTFLGKDNKEFTITATESKNDKVDSVLIKVVKSIYGRHANQTFVNDNAAEIIIYTKKDLLEYYEKYFKVDCPDKPKNKWTRDRIKIWLNDIENNEDFENNILNNFIDGKHFVYWG